MQENILLSRRQPQWEGKPWIEGTWHELGRLKSWVGLVTATTMNWKLPEPPDLPTVALCPL